jgi:hypothetical protein
MSRTTPRPADRSPDAPSGDRPPGPARRTPDAPADDGDPWTALRARRPRIGPSAPSLPFGPAVEDRRRRVDAVRAVLRDRRSADPPRRRTTPHTG